MEYLDQKGLGDLKKDFCWGCWLDSRYGIFGKRLHLRDSKDIF